MMSIFASGCASLQNSPLQNSIKLQAEENTLGQSKNVQIIDEPYLGASVRELDSRSTEFDRKAVLSQRGTISEIAKSLENMFPALSFQVNGNNGLRYRIFYDGTLKGLLDSIAVSTDYGWQYVENTITFSKVLSKTYTIYAMPGKTSFTNSITNKSKDSGSSSSGGGMGQSVTTGDTSMQTAQTSTTEFEYNSFNEVVENVRGLLSKNGTVSANQAAGTITVRDEAKRILLVSNLIEDINEKMGRQVALTVQVWALELNDSRNLGLNLNVLFEDSNLSILAGNASSLSNNVTASIMSGKLKNSQATLQALKEWGNASSVTSASGIVMNNQTLPALSVDRNSYLASTTSEITEYGKTSEFTPGEITTGFAMTVTPHILEKREVILQYNINLSQLEEIKTFSNDDISIELPQISNRAFAQTMRLHMGQTLVLAGYQQDVQANKSSLGFLSGANSKENSKTLLIITIQVENADV